MMADLQPTWLVSPVVRLRPLHWDDFETLYAVASDPLIWEQHPNPDRYKRDVFQTYFEGAMASSGALLISDNRTGEVIGSSRFYDHDNDQNVLKIGYTFFSRSCWGRSHNLSAKFLMLDHAFHFVNTVLFHVGAHNIRSRKAMAKLGAVHTGDEVVSYYGEQPRLNCVFEIDLGNWEKNKSAVQQIILLQMRLTN